MILKHGLNLTAILCIMTVVASCSHPVDRVGIAEPIQVYLDQVDPDPPEGVMQYCWEEPLVNAEKVNAGMDSRGNWWNPAHTSVNEARMGRWRPCREMRSKAYGEDELIPID